jgi:hypothetical protein
MFKTVTQKVFTPNNPPPDSEDPFADLDAGIDADEYARLERTAPWLTAVISRLVRDGHTAETITSHLSRKYAHKWVEIQTIRAACRHAARELAG